MDRQQVEQLHHQASEQYLSGDFQSALVSWQQLLQLNPQDERAREGVRLCGLLTQGDEGASAPPAVSQDGAAGAPAPGAGRAVISICGTRGVCTRSPAQAVNSTAARRTATPRRRVIVFLSASGVVPRRGEAPPPR